MQWDRRVEDTAFLQVTPCHTSVNHGAWSWRKENRFSFLQALTKRYLGYFIYITFTITNVLIRSVGVGVTKVHEFTKSFLTIQIKFAY